MRAQEKEENEIDDIQLEADIIPLKPLAQIHNLFHIQPGESLYQISDLQWILNDTFIMIINNQNEMAIFDPLLYPFNLNSKSDHLTLTMEKKLKI
mmetsp:Transcript_32667/g.31878  ORF Transcript_32667/g.31878 Transcript_32667/m.31878 type:complete len:95 (+) Transcript_32667:55-339(+)|eukprot:CAMPEP_0170564172 /NCGR_PEP_ID=MMETSP0211-20121228/71457_1 /TAXON_ID=311385 /ORGANISM="Pseudokeronopsis sp., Strain OXSARD2" /LENGTH=94 /DNA_ID=CAMNT_0010883327 /DNA_START=43 /DNA_END=327 /DNA_ORIENTATION=-